MSTASVLGAGAIPWLTDPSEGGVTGFVGYANAGPAGWTNAAGLTVGNGTELNGSGLVNTVTIGGQNAELRTKVLPAGNYLMALGGSYACGAFLSNSLAACPVAGGGNYSLTIDQVAVAPVFVRDDTDGDGKADILWRNATTGANTVFLMNSATVTSNNSITPVADLNWGIVGSGDFNADGKSDILWRNSSTGAVALFTMNGTTVSSIDIISTVDTA